MKDALIAYGLTGLVFLVVDGVWLGTMARVFYRPRLGELLAATPRLSAAAVFYAIYLAGIVFFAVAPALSAAQWTTALINGAIFGFCAYATYDLTNQATLRGWSATVSVVDIAWGTVLTAVSASAGYGLTLLLR